MVLTNVNNDTGVRYHESVQVLEFGTKCWISSEPLQL